LVNIIAVPDKPHSTPPLKPHTPQPTPQPTPQTPTPFNPPHPSPPPPQNTANHSFDPNADFRSQGVGYQLVAVRDVMAGDEVRVVSAHPSLRLSASAVIVWAVCWCGVCCVHCPCATVLRPTHLPRHLRSTLNFIPDLLCPMLATSELNPQPPTSTPKPLPSNPKPQTPNPKPQTLKPQTLKPQTPNPNPKPTPDHHLLHRPQRLHQPALHGAVRLRAGGGERRRQDRG